MTIKDEAFGLLKSMENGFDDKIVIKSVIRRLVEELNKQHLQAYMDGVLEGKGSKAFESDMLKPQTKPLSNQEILKFIHEKFVMFGFEADYIVDDNELIEFVRTIEKAHGIQKSVE